MTKFKGNNQETSARRSFFYRALYKRDALGGIGNRGPEIRDLNFAENTLYGRVDTTLNSIYPDENKMQIINSERTPENVHRLINFVADAFEKVRAKMIEAKAVGTIPNNDPIFSSFDIKRSYMSPLVEYDNYIFNLMEDFITDWLVGRDHKRQVFNLGDFVENLMLYLTSTTTHVPFTFTSWQRSTTSNIFTSGLAVDIANVDVGSHPDVEDTLLNSPALKFYLNICRANGFLVSEQMPSVMVADILSPGLLPYAREKFILTTNSVFARNYNLTYTRDYDLMLTKLVQAYNSFVGRYPFQRNARTNCRLKSFVDIIPRHIISQQIAEREYHSYFWLSSYLKIRNIEEDGALSKEMMNLILRQLKTTKNLDNVKAMRYINTTFRETYKKKYGGVNYYINRLKERNKDIDPSTDMISNASQVQSGGPSGGY